MIKRAEISARQIVRDLIVNRKNTDGGNDDASVLSLGIIHSRNASKSLLPININRS